MRTTAYHSAQFSNLASCVCLQSEEAQAKYAHLHLDKATTAEVGVEWEGGGCVGQVRVRSREVPGHPAACGNWFDSVRASVDVTGSLISLLAIAPALPCSFHTTESCPVPVPNTQRNNGAHLAFLARFVEKSATGYVAGTPSPTIVSQVDVVACRAAVEVVLPWST